MDSTMDVGSKLTRILLKRPLALEDIILGQKKLRLVYEDGLDNELDVDFALDLPIVTVNESLHNSNALDVLLENSSARNKFCKLGGLESKDRHQKGRVFLICNLCHTKIPFVSRGVGVTDDLEEHVQNVHMNEVISETDFLGMDVLSTLQIGEEIKSQNGEEDSAHTPHSGVLLNASELSAEYKSETSCTWSDMSPSVDVPTCAYCSQQFLLHRDLRIHVQGMHWFQRISLSKEGLMIDSKCAAADGLPCSNACNCLISCSNFEKVNGSKNPLLISSGISADVDQDRLCGVSVTSDWWSVADDWDTDVSELHYPDTDEIFSCEYCFDGFSSQFVLRKHVQSVHRHMKELIVFVGTSSESNSDVDRHKVPVEVHVCPACDETFTNPDTLSLHFELFHLSQQHKSVSPSGDLVPPHVSLDSLFDIQPTVVVVDLFPDKNVALTKSLINSVVAKVYRNRKRFHGRDSNQHRTLQKIRKLSTKAATDTVSPRKTPRKDAGITSPQRSSRKYKQDVSEPAFVKHQLDNSVEAEARVNSSAKSLDRLDPKSTNRKHMDDSNNKTGHLIEVTFQPNGKKFDYVLRYDCKSNSSRSVVKTASKARSRDAKRPVRKQAMGRCAFCRVVVKGSARSCRKCLDVNSMAIGNSSICPLCGKYFFTADGRFTIAHLTADHAGHPLYDQAVKDFVTHQFMCIHCGKVFVGKKDSLAAHVQVDHRESVLPTFVSLTSKLRRLKAKSASVPPAEVDRGVLKRPSVDAKFQCKLCSRSFLYDKTRLRHQRLCTRKGLAKLKCSLCPKSFNKREHLMAHVSLAHADNDSYVCSVCNAVRFDSSSFRQHVFQHMGTEKAQSHFSCHQCHQSFNSVLRYLTHCDRHCDIAKGRKKSAARSSRSSQVVPAREDIIDLSMEVDSPDDEDDGDADVNQELARSSSSVVPQTDSVSSRRVRDVSSESSVSSGDEFTMPGCKLVQIERKKLAKLTLKAKQVKKLEKKLKRMKESKTSKRLSSKVNRLENSETCSNGKDVVKKGADYQAMTPTRSRRHSHTPGKNPGSLPDASVLRRKLKNPAAELLRPRNKHRESPSKVLPDAFPATRDFGPLPALVSSLRFSCDDVGGDSPNRRRLYGSGLGPDVSPKRYSPAVSSSSREDYEALCDFSVNKTAEPASLGSSSSTPAISPSRRQDYNKLYDLAVDTRVKASPVRPSNRFASAISPLGREDNALSLRSPDFSSVCSSQVREDYDESCDFDSDAMSESNVFRSSSVKLGAVSSGMSNGTGSGPFLSPDRLHRPPESFGSSPNRVSGRLPDFCGASPQAHSHPSPRKQHIANVSPIQRKQQPVSNAASAYAARRQSCDFGNDFVAHRIDQRRLNSVNERQPDSYPPQNGGVVARRSASCLIEIEDDEPDLQIVKVVKPLY